MRASSLSRLLCICAATVCFVPLFPVCSAAQDTAARRAPALDRGVNLSGWLAGPDSSEQHFNTWITAADLQFLHDAGFRSVRLPWNPAAYQRLPERGPQRAAALVQLHKAVDMVLAHGLAVSITFFPNHDYKQALVSGNDGVENFVRAWREVAASFASADPERVFFELMNEPEQPDAYRWVGLESRAVQAIRSVAPNHTILATGAHYSGLDDLLETETVSDPNVIYVFHFYEPFLFTHQGATWTSPEVVELKDIPYPATLSDIQAVLPGIHDELTRYHLYNYAAMQWNAETMKQRLAFAAAWGRDHHVPVIANEFGAFKDTVEPDARARFLHDVRSGLEANGIPWQMWDYRGNFGAVDRAAAGIQPDDRVLGALGLKTGFPSVTFSPEK